MEVVQQSVGSVGIFEVAGRIDSASAPDLFDRLSRAIQDGARYLLVDLRRTVYISSAGFRTLLLVLRQLRASDGAILLCGLSDEVMRLFELSAFTELFEFCGTQEEGLARLSAA